MEQCGAVVAGPRELDLAGHGGRREEEEGGEAARRWSSGGPGGAGGFSQVHLAAGVRWTKSTGGVWRAAGKQSTRERER